MPVYANANMQMIPHQKAQQIVEEFIGLAAFCRANPQYSPTLLSQIAHGYRSRHKDIVTITIVAGGA